MAHATNTSVTTSDNMKLKPDVYKTMRDLSLSRIQQHWQSWRQYWVLPQQSYGLVFSELQMQIVLKVFNGKMDPSLNLPHTGINLITTGVMITAYNYIQQLATCYKMLNVYLKGPQSVNCFQVANLSSEPYRGLLFPPLLLIINDHSLRRFCCYLYVAQIGENRRNATVSTSSFRSESVYEI